MTMCLMDVAAFCQHSTGVTIDLHRLFAGFPRLAFLPCPDLYATVWEGVTTAAPAQAPQRS